MATKLIGLYSPAPQSGKSTVASFLERDAGFTRVGFAASLKRMAVDALNSAGLTPEQIGYYMEQGKEETLPPPFSVSFRYLCQTLGTDWGRNLISGNLWVDIALAKAATIGGPVVIDDMRFPNEFRAISEAGGEVWRIVRPNAGSPNDHPSEGLLEGYQFDVTIVNDGSVRKLLDAASSALRVAEG